MAMPTGSGSEVLKRSYQTGVSDTDIRLIVTTTHGTVTEIATLISVTFTEMAGQSNEEINLYVDCGSNTIVGASGANVYLLKKQPIGAYETFVFSDKVVLYSGDALYVITTATANVDVMANWILQDWT